ncbi:putative Carbohydrate ABC transporter substrate-binding protein (CUT1 family) [Arthrobacter sp. 9AX]|uniref:ABC transporter substrate-binding protein n=1 Tax=Arthrobacter sp. 9AX TaxID=2653131 RepID=UPI0012F2CE37|nr:extracellular solute-binding protein [Arthrobacter sp. 9AX]VXC14596.1 putative Carbohydrate ABC transporter substrate-binding protein (CUT1 family) [Arthrobacter sp. 9AX]
MFRRKGVLAVVTAGVLSAALAACSGGSTATPEPAASGTDAYAGRSITALVAAAGAGSKAQYDEYYKTLSDEFTKATGATVNFQFYSGGAQQNTIVQTSLVSGSGPDVIGYGSSVGGTLAATKGFVTLSAEDWKRVGGREAWNDSTLSASGAGADNSIGIPSFSVPFVIAYNKEYFEKAGISAPPKTWDEWITTAKKVQDANPGVYGAGFDPADPLDPWKFVWSYTHQLGGAMVSEDGKDAQLSTDEVKKATDFYFSQFYEHKIVPPESLSWNSAQMLSAFTSGQVAMLPIATRGTLSAAKGTPVEGKIDFAQLPSVPEGMTERPEGGTPAASIVSGQFWAVFKYAEKNKDLALELAKVSNNDVVIQKQYELLGWAPTTKDGIEKLSKSHPESRPFLEIQANMEATEFSPAWTQIQTGLSVTVNKVAENLATSGQWNEGFLNEQLSNADQAVQSALK